MLRRILLRSGISRSRAKMKRSLRENSNSFPTSFLTRPVLSQIAGFMEKSIAKQLDEMAEDMSEN